jgi:hypothetical protein
VFTILCNSNCGSTCTTKALNYGARALTCLPNAVLLQVLVGGVNDKGGAVVLVDTLAPPSSSYAAQILSPKGTTPTALTLVPGASGASGGAPGAVLVVGDDAGTLQGFDMRVLTQARPLWSVKPHVAAAAGGTTAAAAGCVTCVTCWDPGMVGGSSGMSASGSGSSSEAAASYAASYTGSSGSATASYSGGSGVFRPPSWLGDLVVSGSKDGSLAVVNAHTGSTLQLLQLAHYTERRGLLERVVGSGASRAGSGGLDDVGPLLRVRPASAVAAAVADVAATGEGLVSVGADGVARFHPLAHLLNHWAGDDYY